MALDLWAIKEGKRIVAEAEKAVASLHAKGKHDEAYAKAKFLEDVKKFFAHPNIRNVLPSETDPSGSQQENV